MLYINLIKATPYVDVEYIRFNSWNNVSKLLQSELKSKQTDFLDLLCLEKE